MDKLDSYHYQEVIHMADFIRRMVEQELQQHHCSIGYPRAIHHKLEMVQDLLGEVYDWLANEQELLEK